MIVNNVEFFHRLTSGVIMIIDIAKFIFDKWRRWKYKEDYDSDAKIKADSKNQIIQYKLKDKETFALYS